MIIQHKSNLLIKIEEIGREREKEKLSLSAFVGEEIGRMVKIGKKLKYDNNIFFLHSGLWIIWNLWMVSF